MQKLKVYLAGPMTGYPNHNFPAFNRAAAALRAAGCYVFNPAENELPEKFADSEEFKQGRCSPELYRTLLAEDLNFICTQADAIALLPGWQKSKGAMAEKATADALGLGVIFLNDDSEISAFTNPKKAGVQLDLFLDNEAA